MQRKSILPTVVFYSLFYLDLDRKMIKNKDTQFFFISTAFTFFTKKEKKKKKKNMKQTEILV